MPIRRLAAAFVILAAFVLFAPTARAAYRTAYDCPAAGCNYESSKPGQCPHHKVALHKVDYSYTCPKDGQPVAGPGKCPRCPMDAVEHKVERADATPAAPARSAKRAHKHHAGTAAATS